MAVEGSEIEINSVSVKEYIRASNAVSEITAFAESCAFEVNPDKKVDDVLAACKILQIGTVESLDKMMETAAGRADKFFAAFAKSFPSASGDADHWCAVAILAAEHSKWKTETLDKWDSMYRSKVLEIGKRIY